MQAILPFLLALARSNGLAFLVAFGVLVVFIAPLILLSRRAERRYLLQFGTEVSESGEPNTPGRVENTNGQAARIATHAPQEGGEIDATAGLPARQSTQ